MSRVRAECAAVMRELGRTFFTRNINVPDKQAQQAQDSPQRSG